MINAGSSSIKFASFNLDKQLEKIQHGSLQNMNSAPNLKIMGADNTVILEKKYSEKQDYQYFYKVLLNAITQENDKLLAVGHRVVHGGTEYYSPTLVSSNLIQALKKLIPFAPLHQPYNIEAIELCQHSYPEVPQVACFDTAFHHTHPPVADRFAIPRVYSDAGVKKYGFHGLSYEYIVSQLQKMSPDYMKRRVVVAHLGNGASMCAIKDGKSIDSTMGFTALDGLMMGTRCGAIDPGVILFLMKFKQLSYDEIESLLYQKSGLLGVSGLSSNMQVLLDSEDKNAREAIELFVFRIKKELGALASVLGGIDLLVFTGGIGENAHQIREAVCEKMEWLGLQMDASANRNNQSLISKSNSPVEIRVIPTNEEWIIANHTFNLIQKGIQHGQ